MDDFYERGILVRQKINSLRKELFRKSIHICSAVVPFLLKFAYWPVIILLFLALFFYIMSESLRLRGINIPVVSKITEIAARKRDENKFVLGPVTLVCGIIAAVLLFPLDSARIGVFALSFGDGLASLTGKMIGRTRIPFTGGKTLEGSLACFTAVFVSCLICSGNLIAALVIGFTAMIIEVLPLKDFDNVLIPVAISALYYFVFA